VSGIILRVAHDGRDIMQIVDATAPRGLIQEYGVSTCSKLIPKRSDITLEETPGSARRDVMLTGRPSREIIDNRTVGRRLK
jgi:hypothetical protein